MAGLWLPGVVRQCSKPIPTCTMPCVPSTGVQAPVVVTIDYSITLANYRSGVFNGDCNPNKLNHAVLVVGYNVAVSPP